MKKKFLVFSALIIALCAVNPSFAAPPHHGGAPHHGGGYHHGSGHGGFHQVGMRYRPAPMPRGGFHGVIAPGITFVSGTRVVYGDRRCYDRYNRRCDCDCCGRSYDYWDYRY